MKEFITLPIKGFLIGITTIIPWISGGTVAITLGIYETIIEIISHFLKNVRKNMKFIILLGTGVLLSWLSVFKLVESLYDRFPIPTVFLFIGIIMGGIPMLMRRVKGEYQKTTDLIVFLFFFVGIASFSFLRSGNVIITFDDMNLIKYMLLFVVGLVGGIALVIPGISASFILLLTGYYTPIMQVVQDILHFKNIFLNLLLLLPFFIGVAVGIVAIANVIKYLLKKYEVKTYFAFLGAVLASIISILIGLGDVDFNIINTCIGLLLGFVGFISTYLLVEK